MFQLDLQLFKTEMKAENPNTFICFDCLVFPPCAEVADWTNVYIKTIECLYEICADNQCQ